jgi:hypothetical protein
MRSSPTISVSESSPAPRPARGSTRVRKILLGLLFVLLLVVAYWLTRTALYGWQAYQSGQDLLALTQQEPSLQELGAVQASLGDLASAVEGIDAQLAPLAPILDRLNFLPGIGGSLAAAPELTAAGADLARMGEESLAVLAPALVAQGDALTLDTLLAAVVASSPELNALSGQATRAAETLADVSPADLPYAVADEFAALQAVTTLMPTAMKVTPSLPALLGFERPVTYLLLVQNNHELRATGGFITAAGTLTLDRGIPQALSFTDSHHIFREENEYSWAPDPMRKHMGIELLTLRDANWSPHLPASAVLASTLYAQDEGVQVDGVVTVDLRAVQLLVDALGQIEVEGSDYPITAENIEDQIKLFFDQPIDAEEFDEIERKDQENVDEWITWWRQRKDFIPALAGEALRRLESGDVNYANVAVNVLQALDEGAIQVWMRESSVAEQLANIGWDGGLAYDSSSDYLFYTDTNMGYNKVDSVLERSLAYDVDWPPDGGPAVATTTMTYRHPVNVEGHICDQSPRYGASYDEMAARCYFDYVRLYAPGGSKLMAVEGLETDSITAERGEKGTQRFGGFFVMPPGSEHTVKFTYELPAHITPEAYALTIQRQSGANPLPVTVDAGSHSLSTTVDTRQYDWTPAVR